MEAIYSLDPNAISTVISGSCKVKANVVNQDETEQGIRAILNFGHTIGHAIEALTSYSKFKHGEAIAIGMIYAARLSRTIGQCNEAVVRRIESLIEKFGFVTQLPEFSPRQYIESMYLDKKAVDKKIRFIIIKELGSTLIVDAVSEQSLTEILKGQDF